MIKKLLFTFIFIYCVSFSQLVGPKIFTPADTYNFGNIVQGEKVKHNFIVVNKGDATLKITGVLTSCGCTAANPERDELLPNESTTIKVEFNSDGREGAQLKMISVSSNDEKTPRLSLTIKGNVIANNSITKTEEMPAPRINFEKTQYDFGIVNEGKILEYIFKFKNSGNTNLEIKQVTTSCGCTAANLSGKNIEPNKDGTIKIEFDTANRFGRVSRTITVYSNDPLEPQKVLTVYAEIIKKEN